MSNILNLPLTVEDFNEIHDATEDNIADVWGTRGDEIAAEIVRRVNMHDELVAALREAKIDMVALVPFGSNAPTRGCAKINAVLAKLEAR